jgi:predicted RNase H-like HicB family nuclease
MTQHVIIIERGSDGGYSAWAPDLPGVGVAASSYDEVVKLMGEATSPLRPVTSPSP